MSHTHGGTDAPECTTCEPVPVHNHGPNEGPGLDCPERLASITGRRRGRCLDEAEAEEERPTPKLDALMSEIRQTSATGGQKGQKLPRFDLVPADALRKVAEVYGMGARKYEDNNWRKGYAWSLAFAAMQRHLWAFWNGEDLDPESGLPHVAHAAFHCMTLLTFMDEHTDYDDRWTK